MDSTLKQRLIGAAVLAALAIIFLPMLLKGPDVKEPDAAEVPLTMPATPGQQFETRELELTAPEVAPPGGVLGMAPAGSPAAAAMPVPDDNAIVAAALPADAEPAADLDSERPPVAAAPAPPKPVAPAAVAAGNYAVNIGTFGNLANATALATRLRAAGLPVTADRVNLATGQALRLRVGPYANRAIAEAARLRAESITGAASKVIALDASAVASAPETPKPAAAKPASPTVAKPVAPVVKPAEPVASDEPRSTAVSSGFAVQLSAPAAEAEAMALRDRARGAGFSSFVARVDTASGVRYRVRVGPVADRPSAQQMLTAVNGKLGIKGIVVANP